MALRNFWGIIQVAFWGISQVNQSSNKYSLATSLEENHKVKHLKGVGSCGGTSCTPPGKSGCLITSLQCLYTTHAAQGINRNNQRPVCSHNATTSLQLQGRGGTAHRVGMLSGMATDFLGKTGQPDKMIELLLMRESNWNMWSTA